MNKKNIFSSRRFKHGSLATAITVVILVIIVIINIVATMLLERYPLTIDLTSDKRFELTQDSLEYVKTLDMPVEITVCADEAIFKGAGETYKQAHTIISNYEKHSSNIKVAYVDLNKKPTFAQQYPDMQLEIGDIIVETDLRSKKVGLDEIIKYEQGQYGDVTYSSEAEQAITGAIMYVADENPITVSVLGGSDNADISGYINVLQKNNYNVVTQNILTDEIDKDASMVILSAPAVDYTVEQVKKLETYLDNDGNFGKSLIYVASKDYSTGPVLQNFLADWGMEIGNGVIAEATKENSILDNFTMLNFVEDPTLLADSKANELPFVTRMALPINVLFEEQDNRKTSVITKTSDTTFMVPFDADENFNPADQPLQSHNTIVKSTRTKYDEATPLVSTVVTVGSTDMLQANFLQSPTFSNGYLMMELSNQLVNKEESITIMPVIFTNEIISITQLQVLMYGVLFVIAIPLAVVIIGIIVFVRRRNL